MKTFTVTKKLTLTELHEFDVEASSEEEAIFIANDMECNEDSLISGSGDVLEDVIEDIQ